MKKIEIDPTKIAFCGLYCGACKQYLNEKCPGCRKNEKAKWCKIRTCGMENDYTNCSECKEYTDVTECKKFNNIFSKFFAFIFRSNREGCIERIKKIGPDAFAQEMADKQIMTIKR